MKRYTVLLLLVFSLVSCKKSSSVESQSLPMMVYPVPNVPGVSSSYLPFDIYNVWGVMAAITVRGNCTDSTENVGLYSNTASAIFFSKKNAGTILVNNIALDTLLQTYSANNFRYLNIGITDNDTISYLSDDKWSVSGANGIPAISYDYTGNFPSFTGVLPRTITAANGLSIKFDGSNSFGADSAFIAVCNASANYGPPDFGISYSKMVSANSGTATIDNYVLQAYGAGTGGTSYVEVFLVKYTIKTFGSKQFAFLKMNENIQNVTIN